MSYLVLARKWRPQTFTDLVGQEHVAQTLRNAVAQDRLAHAFLFTGARGVGKTTIARVLAKTLNCLASDKPTAEPCAQCSACTEIANGNDMDVREIDGATWTKVDDIRELQAWLPYRPARDRFKVVIIDEVHMLSSGAFNALLKTLEEPPPHVKFIFATTEVHKVPITILSRCQRYDFKLLPTARIRERLRYILTQEQVAHDEAAVALVAREAAGSMRDALSLLDQAIAGMNGPLTGTEVARLLGVADSAVLYELARSVLKGDAAAALRLLAQVATEGYDLANFARDFLSLCRDLVVARVVPEPDALLEQPDEERADLKSIAASTDALDLERLFLAWSRAVDEVARAREPRWVLEMTLVRLAHRPPLVPIDELVKRLAELEKRLGSDQRPPPGGGGGPSPSRPGGGGSGGGGGGTSASPQSPAGPRTQPATTPRAQAESTAPRASGAAAAAASAMNALAQRASAPAPLERASASVAPAPRPTVIPGNSPLARMQARLANPSTHAEPAPVAAAPEPARRNPAAMDVSAAEGFLDKWREVLGAMENQHLATILKSIVALEVSPATIRLVFEDRSFFARKAATPEVSELLAEAASKVLGERPVIEHLTGVLAEDAPTIARAEALARAALRAEAEREARDNPLVRMVLEHLGGEVKAVRLKGDPT